jgi:hypothetical protein
VKTTMLDQVPLLQGGPEFKADAYGARKDLELSSRVIDTVRTQVDQMASIAYAPSSPMEL